MLVPLYPHVHLGAAPPAAPPGRLFTLALEQLKRLLSQVAFRPWAETKRAEVAFHRWDQSVGRGTSEDNLIDCWVGLESHFAPDSSSEVTYRATLRIAALLGRTATARVALLETMRASYSWRSKIVHGRRAGGVRQRGGRCAFGASSRAPRNPCGR